MKRKKIGDVEEFRKICLHETGVSFCTRRHFGRPLPDETEQYIRLNYSGIDVGQIKEGMKKLSDFLK